MSNPQLTLPSTCKQKHTYISGKSATAAKKRRNKAAGINYLRSYKCDNCYGWHVTSQKKDEAQDV